MIKKTLQHPVTILIAITIASKLIGFLREILLAYYYGAGAEYDLFLVAFTIPVMIISISTYAFPNFIIPRIGEGNGNANTFLTFYWILSAGISILLLVFSRELVLLVDPSLEEDPLALAVNMIRILSVYTLFFNFFNIYKSLLHSEKKYTLPAISQLFIHLTLITTVVLLQQSIGVYAIALGLALGAAVQLLLPMARYHLAHKLKWDFSFAGRLGEFSISIGIILLIEVFGQLYGFFDRYFAAKLETGIISAISYGNVLYMLPTSVFILSVGTFIFPYLRDQFTSSRFQDLEKLVVRSFLSAFILGILIFVFYRFFSELIIRIIYERGAFDSIATGNTASVLSVYSFGVPFVMFHFITARLLLVMKKEIYLLAGNVIGLCIKILFLLLQGEALNIIDIPLSTVIAISISFAWSAFWWMFFYMRHKKTTQQDLKS